MKSPKLIGNLSPAAGVGFGKARALDDVAAPFLTASGPGFITRKKNGFTEVVVLEEPAAADKPVFWLLKRNPPTEARTVTLKRTVRKITPSAADYIIAASFAALNVGANRMAFAMDDTFVPAGSTADYITANDSWAVLGNLRAAAQYRPATPQLIRSFFATGWDSAAGSWRWGYSAKPMGLFSGSFSLGTTTAALVPCQPRVFLGDTSSTAMAEATVPGESNARVHFGGQMFVVGPGKLCGLVCVPDYSAGPRITPYFLSSNDHGSTWSRADATFVLPFVRSGPSSTLHSEALRLMASLSFFSYMGGGKSLFVLRHQAVTTPYALTDKAYIHEAGGFTDISSAFAVSSFTPGAFNRADLFGPQGLADQQDPLCVDPTQYCFGPGCLAVRVFDLANPFASVRLRITRNYGVTWTEVPFTTLLGAGHFDGQCHVVRPYVSTDSPGLIYVSLIESTGVRFFKTDGNFASATAAGFAPGTDWSGATMITRGANPYPQLPDEFGPGA